MANQKLTQLTRITTTDGNEQLYVVDSPDTSPVSRSIHVSGLDYRGAAYGCIAGRSSISQRCPSAISTAAAVGAGIVFSAFDTSVGPALNTFATPIGSNYSGIQVTKDGIYSVDFHATLGRAGFPTTYGNSSITIAMIYVTTGGITVPLDQQTTVLMSSGTVRIGEIWAWGVNLSTILNMKATERIAFTIFQFGSVGFFEPPTHDVSIAQCSLVLKRIG